MASDKSTTVPEPKTPRATSKQGSGVRPSGLVETKSLAVTVKETLESIVVAFILAFVFRAFIVEAFVIPTGSMAVTLYGKQLPKTCSTCGYEYALGISDGPTPTSKKSLCCPNCRMTRDDFTLFELGRPESGDRILVHKWPLDLPGGWFGSKRWDVTVFKDPEDGRTNFIKRLIGMPGEALEIIDGDIYTAKIEELSPDVLDQFDRLRKLNYQCGSGDRETGSSDKREEIRKLHATISKAILRKLKIQRKIEQAPRAQQSLWSNVYNHDFLPNYELRSDQMKPPVGWLPDAPDAAKAWTDVSQRTIKFNSVSDETLYMRFHGDIDDFYAYNYDDAGDGSNSRGGFSSGRRLVGDLRLSFSWVIRAGSGDLVLEMNRDKDKFIATIATSGKVKLEVERLLGESDTRRELIPPESLPTNAFARDRAVRVEFINVDYRVLVLLDGKVVVRTNDNQYSPSLAKLERFCESTPADAMRSAQVEPSAVRIGARNMQCELKHLVLERDVYYRSRPLGPLQQDWGDWGTAGRPILLRPARFKNGQWYAAEYFMLGDNSPYSKDSRLWEKIGEHLIPLGDEYQYGTVPEDQLIGKAFFVYWPAGYRAAWTGGIGLVPNFGRMRWIR